MRISFRLKQFIKLVLTITQKILPESIVNSLLDSIFPLYKSACRTIYLLRGKALSLFGKKNELEMIYKVYEVMPYSLVGIGGLEVTYKLCKDLNRKKIKGNFVELGVAQGGCAALLSQVAFETDSPEDREVWLFDSFEGLPAPKDEDYIDGRTGEHIRPLPAGSCLGELDFVKNLLFSTFNLPEKKIHLVKGWFQDTLPSTANRVGEIALLRFDGDWYESTKICLENLYNQVVSNGAIIIDDYYSCYGCKKAVDEFIESNNLKANMNQDGRGGCYFIKP